MLQRCSRPICGLDQKPTSLGHVRGLHRLLKQTVCARVADHCRPYDTELGRGRYVSSHRSTATTIVALGRARAGGTASTSIRSISMTAQLGRFQSLLVALLLRRRFPLLIRYLGASALILIAAAIRASLDDQLSQYPLLLFYPAVFFTALFFDRGTGVFATCLSVVVSAYLFIEPRFSLEIGETHWMALSIFAAVNLATSVVMETLRHALEALERSRSSYALLLDETAHRTRNDLAMVVSALTLQKRAASPETASALEAAIARIQVISRVQAKLHGAGEIGLVDLPEYLGEVCDGLAQLHVGVRKIAVQCQVASLAVERSTAIAVGLIVNELVTNALKYAFPGREDGKVEVVGALASSGRLRILVRDDGIGCSNAVSGLGTRIVRLLASQHGGSFIRQRRAPGCEAIVELAIR